MINKMLLPLMMMLATIAVVPGNNSIVKANAENNETVKVEEGYITKNLVDKEKGYVYLEDQSESLDNLFGFINRSGDFQIIDWSTDIINEIVNNNTPVDGFAFHKTTDSFNEMKLFGKTIPWYEEVKPGMYYTLIQNKVSVNSVFCDWDTSKEQPLEFIYSLDDICTDDNLTVMLQMFSDYIKTDFTLPLLKIDGETIIELVKENDSYSFKNYNSRVYLGKLHTSRVDEEKEEYNGMFFVEIPFRNYIQTMEFVSFPHLTDEDVYGNEPTDGIVKHNLFLQPLTSDNSIFSPFNFSNLDFKKGQLTAVSADRATKIETAFGYISDYYNLDYIIINNDTLIYTKPTGKYYLDNGREQIYDLFLDNTFKIPFNYDSDSAFVNKLKRATEDIDFNITYYSYSLVFENTDLRENLRDILDDTLRPGGYKTPSISDSDLKDKIGIAPSPIIKQPKSLRRATSSSQVSNAVVDCGQYYAFRYNSNFKIHSVSYGAVQTHDFGLSRLFFAVQDSTISENINYLYGVMFGYSYTSGSNKNKEYSLSIVTGDSPMSGYLSGLFHIKDDDKIFKTDKFGTKFSFRSASGAEVLGLQISFRFGAFWNYDFGSLFCISTEAKVNYEELLSFIYVNQTGDIVNLSALSDKYGKGYTAVIDDDGNITIIDINGNKHPGYHFDKDTGVLKDTLGNQVHGGEIKDDDNNWWKKLLASISTVLIICGTVYLISKIGPTLAIVFTNRSKNKKKKRRK